jgi:pimeloyl-ACP methyl ester carboxylesterase
LLDRFDPIGVDVSGVGICGRMAGSGPPILMLHGYPQTHVMWDQVAPALAENHTVVLADLRGLRRLGKAIPVQPALQVRSAVSSVQVTLSVRGASAPRNA